MTTIHISPILPFVF